MEGNLLILKELQFLGKFKIIFWSKYLMSCNHKEMPALKPLTWHARSRG